MVHQIPEPVNKVVTKVVSMVADTAPSAAKAQTVTIACKPERIEQLWRDPEQLSVVLGDIAEVETIGNDRYRWQLMDGPAWESRLSAEPGRLRYVGTSDDNELAVEYRPAPNDLGTEVTLRVEVAAPGLLSGAAAFKVLYRTRALIQTGEVPTIRSNPSARKSAR